MMSLKDYLNWIFHHIWVIVVSYVLSMIPLLLIHGSFGYTMNDNGDYISNCLMHMASGAVLGFATGLLQKLLLKPYFKIDYSWVWSLVIGFLLAELIAGIILWKLEIYRGLINVFNTYDHSIETIIFALAGLIAGILQFKLLKPFYKNRAYWIIANTLGWAALILSTYLSFLAFILGALAYGIITGFVWHRRLNPIEQIQD